MWWASWRASPASASNPTAPRTSGTAATSAGDTKALCTSARDKYAGRPPTARSSSAGEGARRSGHRDSSQPWPITVSPAGRLRAKEAMRSRASAREAAPCRSRPASARPVEVRWTWASTKAGVTSAPRSSTISSTESACATSAALSEPSHATLPSSTSIAVANGSSGEWMVPPRSRTREGIGRSGSAAVFVMGNSVSHGLPAPPAASADAARAVLERR